MPRRCPWQASEFCSMPCSGLSFCRHYGLVQKDRPDWRVAGPPFSGTSGKSLFADSGRQEKNRRGYPARRPFDAFGHFSRGARNVEVSAVVGNFRRRNGLGLVHELALKIAPPGFFFSIHGHCEPHISGFGDLSTINHSSRPISSAFQTGPHRRNQGLRL